MKKLLWTVAALAALSFAVVGCQNPGDATASTDNTGTTQGSDNSGGNASGSGSGNNQSNAENKDSNAGNQESGGDQTGGEETGTTVTQTWAPFGTLELAANTWDDNGTTKGNYQATNAVLPGNYQAKAGDVIRIVLKGTANKDISNLQVALIDNGLKAGSTNDWTWNVLSDYVAIAETIKAGEAFEYKTDVTVKTDASAAGSSYCKISIMCNGWTEGDSEPRILTLDMPETLSLDVTSLTNGYGTTITVNDDGSVTVKGDGSSSYGQAGISLGGKQDLSCYSKLVVEYSQTDKIKVSFGTEVNAYGTATEIGYPEGATEKTTKEFDISAIDRSSVYFVCFGQAGNSSCEATIYSVKLVK